MSPRLKDLPWAHVPTSQSLVLAEPGKLGVHHRPNLNNLVMTEYRQRESDTVVQDPSESN